MTFKEFLMNEEDMQKLLKRQRASSREDALERRKLVGKPRSNSWGGKASSKENRRNSKKSLKDMQ